MCETFFESKKNWPKLATTASLGQFFFDSKSKNDKQQEKKMTRKKNIAHFQKMIPFLKQWCPKLRKK